MNRGFPAWVWGFWGSRFKVWSLNDDTRVASKPYCLERLGPQITYGPSINTL